jgi:hypothetical protein
MAPPPPASAEASLAHGAELYAKAMAALNVERRSLMYLEPLSPALELDAGALDIFSVPWARTLFRGASVLEALVPAEAVPRFVVGEQMRSNGDDWRKTNVHADRPGSCQYNCACGGAHKLVQTARAPGVRGAGATKSKRVMCKARFSVTSQAEGLVLLRYLQHEHCDACRVQRPRRVPSATRTLVAEWLLADPELQPVSVVERNVARVSQAYAAEHCMTAKEAIEAFHKVRTHAAAWRFGARIRCCAGSSRHPVHTVHFFCRAAALPLPRTPHA